jgi:hypothetical protein
LYEDVGHEGPLPALLKILAANPDGVIVVQDDAIVMPWFLEEAKKAIIPNELMCFCACASEWMSDAYNQGFSYARSQHTLWGQANYYPSCVIQDFLPWLAADSTTFDSERQLGVPLWLRQYSRNGLRGDDMTMKAFLRESGRYAFITLPNLANHRCVRSTLAEGRMRGSVAWVSFLFGKKYLRPWDKTAITEWAEDRRYRKTAEGVKIFPTV